MHARLHHGWRAGLALRTGSLPARQALTGQRAGSRPAPKRSPSGGRSSCRWREGSPERSQAGPPVQARAHDDMVDVRLGERGLHLIESFGDQQLDIRHPQLLLAVLDDDAQPPEQEHPPRHAHAHVSRRDGPESPSVCQLQYQLPAGTPGRQRRPVPAGVGPATANHRNLAHRQGIDQPGDAPPVQRGVRQDTPDDPPSETQPSRPRMAPTGFPAGPGSLGRGSVGGRPRCGRRAACPPAPSG